LFFEAKQAASKKPKLADRYVDLARKIAMKFKMRMPSEYKRMFCPNCYKFLIPGKNLRVRVHEHRIIYCCLECKKFWRKPVGRSRKS
jgi:ribonuclease P protein subunit RPR2